MLDSIIPQLIINQQGFSMQPLLESVAKLLIIVIPDLSRSGLTTKVPNCEDNVFVLLGGPRYKRLTLHRCYICFTCVMVFYDIIWYYIICICLHFCTMHFLKPHKMTSPSMKTPLRTSPISPHWNPLSATFSPAPPVSAGTLAYGVLKPVAKKGNNQAPGEMNRWNSCDIPERWERSLTLPLFGD